MIAPVANSFGSLREMNTCHAPDSGQFCSGIGGPVKVYKTGRRVTLPGRYESQVVPEGVVVVASPAGYIALGPGSTPKTKWVSHSWVAEPLRGKGEGQRLYTEALKAIKKLGFEGIERGDTGSRTPSEAAMRVWSKFERQGRTRTVTGSDGKKRVVLVERQRG